MTLDDLVKVTVYLPDPDAFLKMDMAYRRALPAKPARTTVYSGPLPLGAAVEIEGIAYMPRESRREAL